MPKFSEQTRLKDPLLKQFPTSLWDTCFDKSQSLSDSQRQLMEQDLDTPAPRLDDLSGNESLQGWICILIGHPKANERALFTKATSLGLPLNVIMAGALMTNRVDILRLCDQSASILPSASFDPLHYAVISGSLEPLQWLNEKYSNEALYEMIKANCYATFSIAAHWGHLNVLKWFEEKAPTELRNMIKAMEYRAFKRAAENGNLHVLKWLEENADRTLLDMIKAGDHKVFQEAAAGGHLHVLEWLQEKAPEKAQDMIAADNSNVFHIAAYSGHLHVLEWLEKKSKTTLSDRIKAKYYWIFQNAASVGHLHILEWVKSQLGQEARIKLPNMVKHGDYQIFQDVISGGYLNVLTWLAAIAKEELPHILERNNYEAFRYAAANGHLDVLVWIADKAPKKLQNMIEAENYHAFEYAAISGHLNVLEWLEKKATAKRPNMIKAAKYNAFKGAAGYGHLNVLEWLEKKASAELQNMIRTDNYFAFQSAAANGHLKVLKWFEKKAPSELSNMIKADQYQGFRWAAENGHLNILEWFEKKAPSELSNMIKAEQYQVFRCAAANGYLDILKWIEQNAPAERQAMVKLNNYEAFRFAIHRNWFAIRNYFFSFPSVFSYAEMHEREYGATYVHPFIQEKLATLRAQRQDLETREPHAIFDIINEEESHLCFYMIRNLIRRNDPALHDNLRFLIEIPSVKALLPTAVTPNEGNELLRLALAVGNGEAADILLNVSAVRELAEANNFYAAERRGALDLRQLANNRESSLTVLNSMEQARLKRATDHYQPFLRKVGVSNLITQLRKTLETRYLENPAVIIRDDDTSLALPIAWADFATLQTTLSDTEKARAFNAYYSHKDHTAYRYLSKPNPWMYHNASYVYVNPENTTERWSTFEEYQPLIAMLYVAAIDTKIPATDGFTVATRFEHFIDELAHIGRAHNWDRTRIVVDTAGQPILDDHGYAKMEEYDDGEGDKPTCFSGIKRRLFQSVLGHPLLLMLTDAIMTQELNEFICAHFQAKINDANKPAFCAEYQSKYVELSTEDIPLLHSLNISPEQQEAFVVTLQIKYGEEFDATFKRKLKIRFGLKESGILYANHAEKFSYLLRPILGIIPPTLSPEDNSAVAPEEPETIEASPLDRTMPNCPIRTKLIDDLNRYITSVENGSRRKFTYFQERQKENRNINYHLAKNLRGALQNTNTEIAQVFQNISGQREGVRKQLKSKLIGNFLLSDELNKIIKQGRSTQRKAPSGLQFNHPSELRP